MLKNKKSMNNIPLEINWFAESCSQDQITPLESDWLFDSTSLTQRLTKLSDHQFSVSVLSESWQYLRVDEYHKLGISLDKKCWVREVLLYGADEAWVYARSVALQVGAAHSPYHLSNIGEKPLGAILFSDDSFIRSPLEITRYPMCFLPAIQQYPNLWGRRSSFINGEVSVLVQEIFLPAFWQKLQENN